MKEKIGRHEVKMNLIVIWEVVEFVLSLFSFFNWHLLK